jgi:glutathionyl-hydroquinone reductase
MYLIVNIIDRYLSMQPVLRRELQLGRRVGPANRRLQATIINSDVLIQMYSHCKIKYIMQMENMVFFFAELALMQMKTCYM